MFTDNKKHKDGVTATESEYSNSKYSEKVFEVFSLLIKKFTNIII